MVEDKKFSMICPKCKSFNLEYDSIEPVEDQIKQDIDCNDCGFKFTIWTDTNWQFGDEDGLYERT